MHFGLVNNGGKWEISESDVKILHLQRDYSLNFMFYYYIEITTIENISVLVDFFGSITIEVDPTTSCHYVIGINHDYNKKEKDDGVPF